LTAVTGCLNPHFFGGKWVKCGATDRHRQTANACGEFGEGGNGLFGAVSGRTTKPGISAIVAASRGSAISGAKS